MVSFISVIVVLVLVYFLVEGGSDPEFTWRLPAGPTSIKFLASDKLGEEQENDYISKDNFWYRYSMTVVPKFSTQNH